MADYNEMKKDAVAHMSILAERNVADTMDDMVDAVGEIFCGGSYHDGAKAVAILCAYTHAHYESAEHAEKK